MSNPSISTLTTSPLPEESKVLPPGVFISLPTTLLGTIFHFLSKDCGYSLASTCHTLKNAYSTPLTHYSNVRHVVITQATSEEARTSKIAQELLNVNAQYPEAFPVVKYKHPLNPNLDMLKEHFKLTLTIKYQKNPDEMFAFLNAHSENAREAYISSLDFSMTNITDVHLDTILELCPSVVELDLSNCSIDGSGLKRVSHQLKDLCLGYCQQLQEKSLINLLPNLTQLESLDLTMTPVTQNIFPHIISSLEVLNLSYCKFSEDPLIELLNRFTQLDGLYLTGTQITDRVLPHIPATLEALHLSFCNVSEDYLTELITRLWKLDALYLEGIRIQGNCLEPLIDRDPPISEIVVTSYPDLNHDIIDKFSEGVIVELV